MALDIKEYINSERIMKNPAINYKVEQFKALDEEIDKLNDEKRLSLRNECLKLLKSPENQALICLNYIAGKIKLINNPHEQNVILSNLVLDLYNVRNWDAAEYVASQIKTSAKALRVLGDVEAEKGNEAKKWEYYEEYVKKDNQDTDVIVQVADHFEKLGDKKAAAAYYQRALIRVSRTDDSQKLKEVFDKLLENGKPDFGFFLSFIDNLKIEDEKTASGEFGNTVRLELYQALLSHLIKVREELKASGAKAPALRKNLDDIILTCQRALSSFPTSEAMKKSTLDALKVRYSDNPRYSELIKKYNIEKSTKPAETLENFLSDIQYVEKAYVVTKSNPIKVGIIAKIQDGKATIRYSGNGGIKEVPLSTIRDTHNAISTQHIKAIKTGVPKEKIVEKIFADGGATWLLRTLLYSIPKHSATIKEMKLEVVPSILTEEQWKKISEEMKEVSRDNPYIRLEQGASIRFTLAEQPLTKEEKVLYSYKSVSDLALKVNALLDAMNYKDIDYTSDSFNEIAEDFLQVIRSPKSDLISKSLASLALDIAETKGVNVGDANLFIKVIEDENPSLFELKSVFASLTSSDLKKKFISEFVDVYSKKDEESKTRTAEILMEIFPLYPNQVIPKELKKLDAKLYNQYVLRVVTNFRNYYTPFVFFALDSSLMTDRQLQNSNLTRDRLFKTELMALSALATSSDKESIKNYKALRKSLVDDKEIDKYLKKSGKEAIADIKAVLLSNNGLETAEKNKYKEIIRNRFPDFSFTEEERLVQDEPKSDEVGFFTTPSSLSKKQADLKNLTEVQVPQNLKDIQSARELGDLRENSEYQYAKEHKRELERRINDLMLELATVKVVKSEDVDPSTIGFGTKVVLADNINKKDITYTFLGRWESNPSENIIDINAPIGRKLFGKKPGDKVKFEINGNSFDYTVKTISKVDFK